MKKRILAFVVAATLSISLLPYEVFANLQSPIEGISERSIVGHIDNRGVISPNVELMFAEPILSEKHDTRPGITDGGTKHVDYSYQVDIKEHPNGKSFKSPEAPMSLTNLGTGTGQTLVKGIKVQGLDNGRLYKMSIIPSHSHKYVDGEVNETRPAPGTGVPHPFKYVLTDFDTKIEGKDGSLEVTWEDSGYSDMKYEIGYIQGNYEGYSIDDIKGDSVGNNIQYITSEDIASKAEKYTDSQTQKTRFKYTIDSNIATGQMYSAYVISTTNKIDNQEVLQNKETPKVVTATTEIGLNVYSAGKDKIRLEWDSQLIHEMDGAYKLEETQIKEYRPGEESGRDIATLYGKEGANIGYYEYREPKESTYYQLVFIYKHENGLTLTPQPKTEKVLYVPGELRTKPATPEIPKPIGPSTKVTSENKGEFLVPGDQLPDVPLIDFWKNDHTFHANMTKPPTLNFVWSAYKQDLSLLYDIWVTDDIGVTLSDAMPIVSDLSFSSGQNAEDVLYNQNREEVVGFKHTIREYYNSDMKKLPLVPNKVYYVKIVAKKEYGDEYEPSLPAIVTIMFDSDGEVFAPPVISKPPLRVDPQGISSTSITIGWLETWYEIMAKNAASYPDEKEQKKAGQWNAKVYTTGPSISFINREGATEHILKNEKNLSGLKSIVGETNYEQNYLHRIVNLGKGVKYEYKFMPYEEILQGLESYNATTNNKKSVEKYIEMLMKSEEDPEQNYGWKDITPKKVEDEEYTQWQQHTQDNLKPNTSYVFFVRPYSHDYDGSKLQASLATWIVGTTLPDGEMAEGKPTVPVLSLNGKGDTHIDVEWKYNSAFDYEIRYSRLEDPDQATVWPFDISTQIGDDTYVEDGGTAVVRIDGLFPETTYNVWIRAKQKTGQEISAWSNPVTTKTDLLGAPTAPSGLGIASYQSILEAGQDFKPVDKNHITVEWARNGPDKDLDDANQDSQRVYKEFQYVIEIADNPEFIDRQSVTVGKDNVGTQVGNGEILSRSMVYFDKLIANRPYYVRAKTRLIARDQENDREIIMESDFTKFIRIITKPSQDEYDGGDKVNEVIYPNKIEETYDGTTWTYEILDTQKVINEMVTGNEFRYIVPVQKYRGIHDPKYRVVRIPQPIVSALVNRGMELEIRTNILTMQIPAKALAASMTKTTADGMVEFVFETLDVDKLHETSMGYEYGFLSTPEKMSITLKGNKGIIPIIKVDTLMKVAINMPNQANYMNKNLGGYTYDALSGVWKKGNHQFDKIDMKLTYTTGSIGTYAVYEKSRVPVIGGVMSQSMQNVTQKYDIVGLGTQYQSTTQVSTSEYINIMLGIAGKKVQIKPGASPTDAEKDRAKISGLYIGNPKANLTQGAAINGIVKLYELTYGISVRPNTSNPLDGVPMEYQKNIQKAYTLGLINYIEPGRRITYEELFDLIEQVIE